MQAPDPTGNMTTEDVLSEQDRAPGETVDVAWHAVLSQRAREMVLLKAFGTTAFMTLFFIAYLHLLHDPVFAVTIMPLTPVDHWIGFEPGALFAYVTLWVYVSLPPALMPDRRTLIGYGLAVGLLCVIGLLAFLFWPTAVPTPRIDWGSYPGFSMLKGVDGTGNACPSLHVATAVFSGIWLHRLLRDIGSPRGLLLFNALWCGAIVYSTMATKQHVFIDVLTGSLLGGLAAWWSINRLLPAGRPGIDRA